MSDGMGCKCAAWSANECSCPDVDWRSAREVELEAENKALRKDAERYRWLRNQNELLENNTFYVGIDNSEEPGDINWVGVDLDSAIDAAMEKENDQ